VACAKGLTTMCRSQQGQYCKPPRKPNYIKTAAQLEELEALYQEGLVSGAKAWLPDQERHPSPSPLSFAPS
jgi:hypothetical protein